MGYRIHFAYMSKRDLDSAQKEFCRLKLNDVLCLELCPAITSVWAKCKPLYKKGTELYKKYEDYSPCIVTKKRLREMVDNFLETYRQYVVENSIILKNGGDVEINDDIWNRCLHLPDKSGNVNSDDVAYAKDNGLYCLHQEFIKTYNKEHFLDILDNKDRITYGNTMYDILVQLIYMYKTFSNSRKLIVFGW